MRIQTIHAAQPFRWAIVWICEAACIIVRAVASFADAVCLCVCMQRLVFIIFCRSRGVVSRRRLLSRFIRARVRLLIYTHTQQWNQFILNVLLARTQYWRSRGTWSNAMKKKTPHTWSHSHMPSLCVCVRRVVVWHGNMFVQVFVYTRFVFPSHADRP